MRRVCDGLTKKLIRSHLLSLASVGLLMHLVWGVGHRQRKQHPSSAGFLAVLGCPEPAPPCSAPHTERLVGLDVLLGGCAFG